MQQNVTILSKQAIKEALKGNWDTVIALNTQILNLDPKNTDAKLRLGHAFIQTKHLIKAKKVFQEVLKYDPINPVALKNIQLIKKNVDVISPVKASPGALIKEPGTTTETKLTITTKRMTAESFASGESLLVRQNRSNVEIYRVKNDKEILIGTLDDTKLASIVLKAMKTGVSITGSFIKGTEKDAFILLKSTEPIFKSEKQDIRPYIKKGSLDDIELDEENVEVETEPTY